MERLTITRREQSDQGTFGRATFSIGGGAWYSGELPWRDNHVGESCIPAALYTASIYDSPKHGPIYRLDNVPNRTEIEIHPMNWMGDESKGFFAQALGCIGLGRELGFLRPPEGGAAQRAILESKQAIAEFMAAADNRQIEIEIIDAIGQGVL